LIGKQNALKKHKGALKHTVSIQKEQQNKRKTPEKPKEKLHQNPNFLPLTRLEPTPLALKLIEHSKFLTSLFPFFLFIFLSFLGGESES
jgi:hypothetical protein